MGPRPKTVEATVFERLVHFTKAMPEYNQGGAAVSYPRKTKFNNIALYLTIKNSEDDFSKILDYYANLYATKPQLFSQKKINQYLEKLDDSEIKENIQVLMDVAKKLDPQFRVEKRDWAVWSTLEYTDRTLEYGSKEYFEKFKCAMDSGKIGKFITGRMVIAFREPNTNNKKILNIWTDQSFNLNNLRPDSSGDMPGKDIQGVPRYPGSRRNLTMEQENMKTLDSVVVYEGDGSVVSNILFYHSRMEAAGWKTDPTFEQAMKAQESENLLFYTNKDRECTIQINQDENSGKIITTVIERKKRA